MFELPASTAFNKRIPKQKFYENLQISPALKRSFSEQIKAIFWRNKIAASTVNLAAGNTVTEVEVFTIRLNGNELDENVLKQIDREVPYHILFLLEYDDKVQAWIGYKESSSAANMAFKVNRYYHTDWLPLEDLPLKLEGLSLDAVYENFVRQIAGDALNGNETETLKEAVDRSEQRALLQKQIAALEAKVFKEKQLNKQVQLNTKLKQLRTQFEEL